MSASILMPDPVEAAAVRDTVHVQIIEGFQHLVAEAMPLTPEIEDKALSQLAALQPTTLEPALCGLFSQLRDAAIAGDVEAFQNHRNTFLGWSFAAPAVADLPVIRPMAQGAALPLYDRPEKIAAIQHCLADDVGLTTALSPPSDAVFAREQPLIARACHILAEAAPDWAGECFHLVREIILAIDARPESENRFAGGSVFDLFGAILINPASKQSLTDYILTVVHESSHLRLFCYHLDDEVVLNEGDALYRSPLRREPRPMEGIYHAGWVSARMAVAGQAVLDAPNADQLLSPEERHQLQTAVVRAARNFADALSVVREHGKLTALGQRIIDDSEAAVAALGLEQPEPAKAAG